MRVFHALLTRPFAPVFRIRLEPARHRIRLARWGGLKGAGFWRRSAICSAYGTLSMSLFATGCEQPSQSSVLPASWPTPATILPLTKEPSVTIGASSDSLAVSLARLRHMELTWTAGGAEPTERWQFISDVETDAEGNVYVLDRMLADVRVFSPDGKPLRDVSRRLNDGLAMPTITGLEVLVGDTLVS
jgi:hypothetical protein